MEALINIAIALAVSVVLGAVTGVIFVASDSPKIKKTEVIEEKEESASEVL